MREAPIAGTKFVCNGILYQAWPINGNIIIADEAGIPIHTSDILDDATLKAAAVKALTSKPRFELITARQDNIEHQFFSTKEAAYATMLLELKEEFEKYYDEDDITWADVLSIIEKDGSYGDSDFEISNRYAWSYLDPKCYISWKIFDLEEGPKIVDAEFTFIMDDKTRATTPCKVNLDTKEVFAIVNFRAGADCNGSIDKQYISFFGMIFKVYKWGDLDPQHMEGEYWYN